MKERQSRYVTGGESFSKIARRPTGSVVRLQLNLSEEGALLEVSKSLKAAFSRAKRRCSVKSGNGVAAFDSRRAGEATHLWVTVL
jgi:hypothetical protein